MWTSAHIRFLEETLFSSVRRCLCPCRWWQNARSVCYSDAIADFHKIFMESQLCWLCPTSQSLWAISEGVTLMQLVTGHLLKYSGLDAHDVQQWRYFHSLEEKRKSKNLMICFDLACFFVLLSLTYNLIWNSCFSLKDIFLWNAAFSSAFFISMSSQISDSTTL